MKVCFVVDCCYAFLLFFSSKHVFRVIVVIIITFSLLFTSMQDGLNGSNCILEVVTPVEIVVKPKNGGASISIELSRLREGAVTLLKP
jgi:hypothetical protein